MGGEGGVLSMQMIKNFTPANTVLSFCHQGFAGLNMFINSYLKRVISF